MRIDKYLKNSRLIKRRTIAKEACDQGRVLLNGRPAKAGSEVQVGDEVKIVFGSKEIVVRVTDVKESVRKDDAQTMYEVLH